MLRQQAERPPFRGILSGSREIAEYAGVHYGTVCRWVRQRGFPVFFVGRKMATTPSAIDMWIVAQTQARVEAMRRESEQPVHVPGSDGENVRVGV